MSKADVSPLSPRSFTATYQCLRLRLITLSSSRRLHRLPQHSNHRRGSLHLLSGSLLSHLTVSSASSPSNTKGCCESYSVKIKSVTWKRCCAGTLNLITASDRNSSRSKGLKSPFSLRRDVIFEREKERSNLQIHLLAGNTKEESEK